MLVKHYRLVGLTQNNDLLLRQIINSPRAATWLEPALYLGPIDTTVKTYTQATWSVYPSSLLGATKRIFMSCVKNNHNCMCSYNHIAYHRHMVIKTGVAGLRHVVTSFPGVPGHQPR